MHLTRVDARQRQVESPQRLCRQREVAIHIGRAGHIAHGLYLRILTPYRRLLVAATLQRQSHLGGESVAVCGLAVKVYAIYRGTASVASFLYAVALLVASHIL